MGHIFDRLLEVLCGASQAELRRQVQFLRAENQILRARLPRTVRTTPAERARLVKLARPLGAAVRHLVSIVRPGTLTGWIRRAGRRSAGRRRRSTRRAGRPRTPAQVRTLILRMARETDWGYTRMLGELRKLGVRVSRGTVANILREMGVPTAPQRGEGTWDGFVTRHARTLWACDFVSKRVWTPRGLVTAFVLVFLHIGTRRVHASAATTRPDAAWIAAQARGFARVACRGGAAGPRPILLRDRDGKFGPVFDAALRAGGIRPKRLPPRAPNLNAYCERFVQTVQLECLDRFIVLGTGHLDYLVREYADHYNRHRPHSAIGFKAPSGSKPRPRDDPPRAGDVRCRQRLGGLIRQYSRRAA